MAYVGRKDITDEFALTSQLITNHHNQRKGKTERKRRRLKDMVRRWKLVRQS